MSNQHPEKSLAKQLVEALFGIIRNIQLAGEICARGFKEDPDFVDHVRAEAPDVTGQFLRRLAKVGTGEIHPNLFLSTAPAAKLLQGLDKATQEKYTTEPVPLVIQKPDGSWDVMNVGFRELSDHQAKQVISENGIRTEREQRLWLEDQRAKNSVPKIQDCPWRIVKKELVVMTPCKLTASDLAKILARLNE